MHASGATGRRPPAAMPACPQGRPGSGTAGPEPHADRASSGTIAWWSEGSSPASDRSLRAALQARGTVPLGPLIYYSCSLSACRPAGALAGPTGTVQLWHTCAEVPVLLSVAEQHSCQTARRGDRTGSPGGDIRLLVPLQGRIRSARVAQKAACERADKEIRPRHQRAHSGGGNAGGVRGGPPVPPDPQL